jgi:2-amino-4-hydroxy-6-hydroxymethyldihydropteridine diphosphokinase
MSRVFLMLGGNLGDREVILEKAVKLTGQRVGRIVRASPLYETEPWGLEGGADFLNQALDTDTNLAPRDVLTHILSIETMMGRYREEKNLSRTLDIDILFYDDLVMEEQDLIIPHPRLHRRLFVLIPMNDIAGDYIHPVFHKTVRALLAECHDKHRVTPYPANQHRNIH